MKPQTDKLKKQLKQLTSVEEKIQLLKNKYKDEECYILTAGPSIKDYDPEYIKEKLKDKLVIAVKQTYNIAPDIVDIHLLNPFNYQPYDYTKSEPVILMTTVEGLKAKTPKLQEDLMFYINRNRCKKEDSVAIKLNYEDYLLDKNNYRPFGPGIIHEVGIYLPILFGVKKINVLGWDLGEPKSDEIKRFYEVNEVSKMIQKFIMNISPSFYNKVYVRVLNKINYYRFLMGNKSVILNNPGIALGEAKFIAKSTKELYLWLKNKDIELNIISNSSMVDKIVPRVRL
jgi:hypothetical protein